VVEKIVTRRKTLKKTKKFFRKNSQTKHLDFKRAIGLIDTLDDTFLSNWKKKNSKAMRDQKINFADYVNVHLYGNGKNEDCVDNVLNHLLDFHPEWFKKSSNAPIITEMVTHVGMGSYDPKQVPRGIDENYFNNRNKELQRVLSHPKLKDIKLYNYKYAFR